MILCKYLWVQFSPNKSDLTAKILQNIIHELLKLTNSVLLNIFKRKNCEKQAKNKKINEKSVLCNFKWKIEHKMLNNPFFEHLNALKIFN